MKSERENISVAWEIRCPDSQGEEEKFSSCVPDAFLYTLGIPLVKSPRRTRR